jgi:hypothetical protein
MKCLCFIANFILIFANQLNSEMWESHKLCDKVCVKHSYNIVNIGQYSNFSLSFDSREDIPADTEAELTLLLGPKSQVTVRGFALQHVLGMTGTEEGRTFIAERTKLLSTLLKMMFDPIDALKKDSEKCVINLAAEESIVAKMLKLEEPVTEAVEKMLEQCLDSEQTSGLTLSILNNMTRISDGAGLVAKVLIETESLGLKRLVDTVSKLYEKKAETLRATCTLLMNLTQVSQVRQALMMPPDYLLLKLVALMSLSSSSLSGIKGVVGAVKNCCFEYGN